MTTTKLEVLTPANCQIIFIDHQPQMAFGVQSIDRQVLKNNTVALAKAAKVFNIPTIITTVETESFSVTPILSCWTCSRARTFWSVPP
jgi:Amidases related to nicotinamidase